MITKLHVVTTHGEYLCTVAPEDAPEMTETLDETVTELAKLLGNTTGQRDFKLKVDNIGWVAFNPSHIVTIEIHEDES